MSTPDYTAQAQDLLVNARVVPYDNGNGYMFDLIDALNLTVDVVASSLDDARVDPNVVALVAQRIEGQRDA